MNSAHHQSGFTLIETILYVSLFVLLIGSVVVATYNMIASTDKSQYRSLIHNEAQFGIRKLHWLLNGATVVSVPSANSLQITNSALSGNPITVQLNSGKLAVQMNSETIDLTGDIAPITQLTFLLNPSSGVRPVEVQMIMQIQNTYYNETFTTKKLLR